MLADDLRIATFNASLSRKGPGLLLKDIVERDRQVVAVARIIKTVRPDVLLLNEFDHDLEGRALAAFLDLLRQDDGALKGIDYPYSFAPPQNVGLRSGLDLDGDGKTGGGGDAFGFGTFRGQYAMALISRLPIGPGAVDLSALRWADFPGAQMPTNPDGSTFPTDRAAAAMRLSSKGHWAVPLTRPDGSTLWIVAAHPTPPVFDGPEDRNGLRNADEIRLLAAMVDGTAPGTGALAGAPLAVLGDLNADPMDGDGIRAGIRALLSHPRLQDPRPASTGAAAATAGQGGANARHRGDPALDTTDWRDDPGPGNLRVDYVLPSRDLSVLGAGTFWPAPGEPGVKLLGSGRRRTSDHHLVWVDVD